jgi:hypothetical protein
LSLITEVMIIPESAMNICWRTLAVRFGPPHLAIAVSTATPRLRASSGATHFGRSKVVVSVCLRRPADAKMAARGEMFVCVGGYLQRSGRILDMQVFFFGATYF